MSRPFLLGLTGSVGMGKSTTAALFAEAGVPVWDADAAVHRLYAPGAPGAAAIGRLVPAAAGPGGVNRAALWRAVLADAGLLAEIEAAIHPLVAEDRECFLAGAGEAPVVVCDIPLLFETGAEAWLDAVLVVTAAPDLQRSRVLARPGMTEAAFRAVLARQMPDAEKRARADYVIATDEGVEVARAEVLSLLERIRTERSHA